MKILLVHNFYQQPGGEDVVFAQEQRLLARQGHEVLSYTRTNHEAENGSLGDRIRLLKTIVSAEDSREQVAALLTQEKPDLVHIHNTFMMISPSIYGACAAAGVPAVQTLHNFRLLCPATTLYRDGHVCEDCTHGSLLPGVRHGCYRESKATTAAVALMLKVHRARGTWQTKVNGFIALTQFAKHKLVANGLPEARVYVKPNFVDPDPGERESPGNYALFAGRLTPEKGVFPLLDAWGRLKSPIPLRIVGDGPSRAAMESQARQHGLRDVTFLGRLDGDQTRAAMREARFILVPSLWYEGFPMVLAESFACGVPVIASRLGAMEEIITHGETGLHFAPGDSEDLARTVETAWGAPEMLAAMGRRARQEYEAKYTAEANYAALMEIYQKAMATSLQ